MGRKKKRTRGARAVRQKRMLECGDPGTPTPVAVVDTNVIVELFSVHDVKREFEAKAIVLGKDAWEDPLVKYRVARARAAMLLALHFNDSCATTCS